jgi:hypothetical protein
MEIIMMRKIKTMLVAALAIGSASVAFSTATNAHQPYPRYSYRLVPPYQAYVPVYPRAPTMAWGVPPGVPTEQQRWYDRNAVGINTR